MNLVADEFSSYKIPGCEFHLLLRCVLFLCEDAFV